ncbi:MAG: PAS domain S-box protein [Desulfobulbaceae bacterium]|nr:PAS domain S-box protein [Desulfobulbaceae bacterium]
MTDRLVSAYSEALAVGDKALFDAFLARADDAGYGKYLKSHAAAWQKTIADLAQGLIDGLDRCELPEPIRPDEQFAEGSSGSLGRMVVPIYKGHGLAYDHFLGLVKLLRVPFLEMARRVGVAETGQDPTLDIILRFFDKFELGLSIEWHRQELALSHRELRAAKHYILYEKRRYYTIFHRMIEPAFVVDNQARICDVNQAFEDFFGVKGRDVIGKTCCEVLDARLCSVCALEKSLTEHTSFSNVEVCVPMGGEERTVLLAGTYLGDLNGEFPMSIVVLQDVTGKKRIERALKESEEKYRTLIENVPDVTWRADSEGNLLFISPNVKKVCGYTAQGLTRNGRLGKIHPDDLPGVVAAYEALFSRRQRFDVRYRFRRKDGEWIWLHDRAVEVFERNGLRSTDGVFADVTALKAVEDELERHRSRLEELVAERTAELSHSNELLRQEIGERRQVEDELRHLTVSLRRSNAELEQFAHVVSHDLREPLMLIVAFSERLLQRCGAALDEKGMEYLERVLRSARHLERMVDELLQLARISTRGMTVEPLDLGELLEEVVETLEERILQVQGRVDIGSLHSIEGDRVLVRQLFQNVLANALKYRKDDVAPRVVIAGRLVDDDFVEVSVTDNGIGFDEKYLDRIFVPFERLECGNKYEGTGIGLATCEKIVIHHGGLITAKSTPGVGTTFFIRLPVHHGGHGLKGEE